MILLFIGQNTISYGQKHYHAFDHMEFCFVINLPMGGNWAVILQTMLVLLLHFIPGSK